MNFDKCAGMYHFLRRNGVKEYTLLKQAGKFKKTDRILEVGGGTGAVAGHFAPEVKEVTVLDPSTKMLEKIKDPCIRKKIGSCQKIPFKNETFDVVYVVDALHHFTNGYEKKDWSQQMNICAKELLRVLKKNGQLLIVEFNPDTLVGKLIAFFENGIVGFGSLFFTPTALQKLFSTQANIKVFYSESFCYVIKIVKK
ncbi:MAG: class I SAM-dependent methyltransferase [Nanoarchaeota archaeon]